ncbi:hypothetical protein AX16_010065 [Volvariella volvacea WC 439]|nr:hypothetical protein AX16_010065 [Volvariella volvacea WC 439]
MVSHPQFKVPLDDPDLVELTSLRKEHDETLVLLEKQKRRIGELESLLNHQRNQQLPVLRLPFDLLSSILRLSQVVEEEAHGRGSWSYMDDEGDAINNGEWQKPAVGERWAPFLRVPFELRMCHVCKDWKWVAQETHSLWQVLILPRYIPENRYPWSSYPQWKHGFERRYVRLYVQNSKAAELNIRIHLTTFDLWNEIWPLLLPTVSRWRRFSLSSGDPLPSRTMLPALSDLSSLSAPLLEDLCIRETESDFRDDMEDDWESDFDLLEDFRQDHPKLSHARTWIKRRNPKRVGYPVREAFFAPPINPSYWKLSDLEIKTLLGSCPALQHLSIHGTITSSIQPAAQLHPRVSLPSLKSLRWGGHRSLRPPRRSMARHPIRFHSLFHTPNLQTITFSRFDCYSRHMEGFLFEAIPSVRILRFEDWFCSPTGIEQALRCCPNLVRFDLVYTHYRPLPGGYYYQYDRIDQYAHNALKSLLGVGGRSHTTSDIRELRIWLDSPECCNPITLRKYLSQRPKGQFMYPLTLKISDIPPKMTKWLLVPFVEKLEVMHQRPETWPWWEDVLKDEK